MNLVWLALLASLALAGVHGLTPALERLPARHQSALASVSAGAGLAYVFLYLLVELVKEGATEVHAWLPLGPDPLETIFMLLLGAVTVIYLVMARLQQSPDVHDDHRGFATLFLIYNVLAGAGLVEEARWGALNLVFYVAALGLHLLFNDRFLAHLCPGGHTGTWRASLASAPVLGCVAAAALNPPQALLYSTLAVVAGGMILNVVRLELPLVEDLRPAGFVAGVLGYGAIILATWRF
ncbi:MAG: hypothetical protein ACK46X_02335 [Candidatus Sericytochromatia bacterium]